METNNVEMTPEVEAVNLTTKWDKVCNCIGGAVLGAAIYIGAKFVYRKGLKPGLTAVKNKLFNRNKAELQVVEDEEE